MTEATDRSLAEWLSQNRGCIRFHESGTFDMTIAVESEKGKTVFRAPDGFYGSVIWAGIEDHVQRVDKDWWGANG